MQQQGRYIDFKTRTRPIMKIQYKSSKSIYTFKSKIESKSTIKVGEEFKPELHKCPIN